MLSFQVNVSTSFNVAEFPDPNRITLMLFLRQHGYDVLDMGIADDPATLKETFLLACEQGKHLKLPIIDGDTKNCFLWLLIRATVLKITKYTYYYLKGVKNDAVLKDWGNENRES